ncbi:MAG: sigma 54-interacting transcriptional regulator [Acidobacteriota bacterium]
MPKDPGSTRPSRGRAEGGCGSAPETPHPQSVAGPTPPGVRAFAAAVLPRALTAVADGHGATALAQELGAGLVRAVGFQGLRVELADDDGAYGWLFDDGADVGEMQRRSAQDPAGRVRVSACWHGGDGRWLGLLESVARLVAKASTSVDFELQAPAPVTLDTAMIELEDQLERIADGDLAVLVRGESGTGKEVAARRLHALTGGPFVDLNCAALPRDLLEAELFGVEKGVATGVEARAGKFELAHGGTLFLDEIGDMGAETQAKLLRVLQEGEVYRLGGERPRPARPRVIAATHRDLRARLDGRFRADLFHRLCGFESVLPPLRDRSADAVNLAAYFLDRSLGRRGLLSHGISPRAADTMRRCAWPGNVRQLEREMERAALFLEPGEILGRRHLTVEPAAPDETELPLAEALARVEARVLEKALEDCGGDATAAAAALGVARSTFYRRIKELGLEVAP